MIKILQQIQTELKAPKNQYNSFGKYNYRSCEDILEGVKPLLAKHNAVILISDEMIERGGRLYVEATAAMHHGEKSISVKASAREGDNKKGMDDAQLTGATSSYARKYALNGLLLIDDTKDADATNDHGKDQQQSHGSSNNQQSNNDKPWYNDFEKHKPNMLARLDSREFANTAAIITKLETDFKLSKETKEKILALNVNN